MRRFQNYIRDVVAELKKVTWPTRDELKGSTITVIVFSAISAIFVFGVDSLLSLLVQFVLGRGI
jgi:preprotein translocase subunit SecE